MTVPHFEKALAHFSSRSWPALKSMWMGHLPDLSPPGALPSDLLEKYPDLGSALHTFNKGATFQLVSIEGLRSDVFHEAIFLLHKAFHVLGAAETHAKNGLLTWAQSSGYQAAYISANAFIRFLGFTRLFVDGNEFVVDCWYKTKGQTSLRRRAIELGEDTDLAVIRFGAGIGHTKFWELWKKCLRISQSLPIPRRIMTQLQGVSAEVFVRDRNLIHYSSSDWLFDDLFEYIEADMVITNDDTDDYWKAIFEKSAGGELSIILGLSLTALVYRMFESIAEDAPIIRDELELIRNGITTGRHPFYANQIFDICRPMEIDTKEFDVPNNVEKFFD